MAAFPDTSVAHSRAAAGPARSAGPAQAYPEHLRAGVESYLESLRFVAGAEAAGLEEAIRYSLLAGGKRIRLVLALATASAIGREPAWALPLAVAMGAHPHLLADPRRPPRDGR
jgi:hypothetical protein